jgi:hypothetical protein
VPKETTSASRAGIIYLILATAGAAGALAVAYFFHLGGAGEAVTLLPGTASSYLAWTSFHAAQGDALARSELSKLSDDLALAVDEQWRAEVQMRRLNDPYPLPVSWKAAPDDLVDNWSRIVSMAREWSADFARNSTSFLSSSDGLSGEWSEIVDTFVERVPTRRLLILGGPGAGKTMLMIRLIQGLIARKKNGLDVPVPVIFSLGSWNPVSQDLTAWLTECLMRDYQGLGRIGSKASYKVSPAYDLLTQGYILPILDGFDELPADSRPIALDAINQSLSPGQGFVLSSRTDEFRNAAAPDNRIGVKLVGVAGIELQSLNPSVAAEYLLRDAGDTAVAARRWQRVINELGRPTPVGLAFRTPLMLFLARTAFNPRPGEENSNSLPDPAFLCNSPLLNDKRSVEEFLLAGYIPAAYRPRPGDSSPRWSVEDAERVLILLSHHLENAMGGSPDLAWWQLCRTLPRRPITLALWTALLMAIGPSITMLAGLLGGLMYGFTRALFGDSWSRVPADLVAGLTGGACAGTAMVIAAMTAVTVQIFRNRDHDKWMNEIIPSSSTRWTWNSISIALILISAVLAGLFSNILFGSSISIAVGLILAIVAIIVGGMNTRPVDTARAEEPNVLLHRERRGIIVGGTISAVLATMLCGVIGAVALSDTGNNLTYSLARGVSSLSIVGAFCGLIVGLMVRVIPQAWNLYISPAWYLFTVTRWYLWINYKTPLNLLEFLADAHERRGVLRQVAGVYQFRHLDLQRHLASRPIKQ